MHLSAGLRYSAVGAAAASLGIIVVAHAGFSATYWLQSGAPGWTIYPPLSALPQAIAESSVNPFEYSMYIGLVTAALVAGVVALGALVAGLILRRRQTQLGISLGVPAWLPLVLLIPTAVHLSGIAYHQKQMEELESLSPEQVSAAETLPNQAVATDDAVE